MGEDYIFERVSRDRFDDIAVLAEDAFGVKPSAEVNERLFNTSAWGCENIGYLAYDKISGEPAAFYGIFPCYVEYDGKQYLAAQSGSTMTHSRHRKKGLFYETGKRTFELARKEGIKFVYGFPNPNSYPGLMKLGWKHEGNMNSYRIPVPTFPLGFLTGRLKFLEPVSRRWFRFIAGFWRDDYKPFSHSGAETGVGTVSRDDSLLGYKAENDQRLMLRIGENTVWMNQQNGRLGLGDVKLSGDGGEFRRVLRTIKLIGFLGGVSFIRAYASPDSRLDRLFRDSGYRPDAGLAICHLDLGSELPLDRFKYVYADFDTF